ncbi:HlyD family efflux transporter periplasmic adaptor subunit [Candidatus Kapabacteria bacterium]|nr:HlyD family efflux transporter periplasmic adaptor subunit [Candidatus Kapabacteria bacterium]
MIRKIIVAIAGLLLVILSIVWTINTIAGKEVPQKKAKPASVKYAKTTKVKYNTFPAIISATGRLNSFNKTILFSEVQGKILMSDKPVKTGIRYSKGETIISVDPSQVIINLKSAKSNFLSLISSSMADIKADYPSSFDKFNEFLNRFSIDKPLEDLPEVSNAKLKFFLSNRNIYKTYYDIKNIELQYSKHRIIAPFDCVVISSNIDEGGLVRTGQQLATISQLGSFELELSVQESEIDFIKIGNTVTAKSIESDKSWSGKIIRIGGNIDSGTQSVKIFAKINGYDLIDGMYLDTEIEGKSISNVFKIDRAAIKNSQSIFYLDDNGLLSEQYIKIILQGEKYSYIRGIDSNTVVIAQTLANVPLGTSIQSIENEGSM